MNNQTPQYMAGINDAREILINRSKEERANGSLDVALALAEASKKIGGLINCEESDHE